MAILLKLMGCGLMMAGTAGYGYGLAARYRQRIELLLQLRQMIYLLRGQILYANATLEEAFRGIGEKNEDAISAVFCRAAGRIGEHTGEPFAEIWEKAVETLDRELPLTRQDRQSLAAMARHLGYLNRDVQERNLLLYLEELDGTIRMLKEQQQEKCRLYRSLGVMSGLFLAVIIL